MVNVLLDRIVAMPLVCQYWQKSGFECLKALAEIVWGVIFLGIIEMALLFWCLDDAVFL